MKDLITSGAGIAAAIVGLAIVATLVAPKAQTAKIATAFGNVFTGSLKAAKG